LFTHMSDADIRQEIAALKKQEAAYRAELLLREDIAAKQAKRDKEAANAWRVLRDWNLWLGHRDGKTYRELAVEAQMSRATVAQRVHHVEWLLQRCRTLNLCYTDYEGYFVEVDAVGA
jgi:hypothetical protein